MSHINFGKHLPRRTFLRGLGATIALPLLDGMVPAFAQGQGSRAIKRLAVVYVPNGMNMANWKPKTEGTNFDLPPVLQPLGRYKDKVLVLSGMSNLQADPLPGEGLGDHSRAQSVFLTGVHPKKTEGADIRAGISMDQIVARQTSKETELASLELALEDVDLQGGCEDGYSCAYAGTIAWRTPSNVL